MVIGALRTSIETQWMGGNFAVEEEVKHKA